MKYVKEHINEKFKQESDPIHDLGIGNFFSIDFFYADYPSIEDAYVVEYIENLKFTIESIDSDAVYEIRMTDFSDGFVNFKGSKLSGKEMLKKLKGARAVAFDEWDTNLASWDFGYVVKGSQTGGKLYDPEDYESQYYENCGELITGDNELIGDGYYCESCALDDEEY